MKKNVTGGAGGIAVATLIIGSIRASVAALKSSGLPSYI